MVPEGLSRARPNGGVLEADEGLGRRMHHLSNLHRDEEDPSRIPQNKEV